MTRKFEQSMGLRARSHPSAKQGAYERSLVALLKSRGPLQLIEAVTPLPTRRGFISDGAVVQAVEEQGGSESLSIASVLST